MMSGEWQGRQEHCNDHKKSCFHRMIPPLFANQVFQVPIIFDANILANFFAD
jgi:hypothetical protein